MRSATNVLLLDGVLVGVLGLVVGLVANRVSPRGLALTRDYFPAALVQPAEFKATAGPEPKSAASASAAASPGDESLSAATGPATPAPARTKRGWPLASHNAVVALFHDPRYAAGQIVFIDARDDEHYTAGHIPGAYQFDHYHPDRYVATVLGAAAIAERIVVYCNGGDCEDSELAAIDLQSFGVPVDKLVVYGGGITEWKERQLPLEAGARGSGKPATP
jgi:rhodanese-related sulfurtransferase